MRKIKSGILRISLLAFICALLLSGSALAAESRMLVPGGSVIGIKVECQGVMVAGINEVQTLSGAKKPALDAGLRAGDIITRVGDAEVESVEDFRREIGAWSGGMLELGVVRAGENVTLSIAPERDKSGAAEIGVWLRDGMAGLGTLTFYEPETGLFGALGHAVNDVDTGVLIPLRGGSVARAEVSGVIAGERGKPGELLGSFDPSASAGSISRNTGFGIFGTLDGGSGIAAGQALPIAAKADMAVGPATVLAGVDGQTREYAVEISRVYPGDNGGRDMLISVTDPELLEKTGGIVQGMSGSPILQNGRLVGAVTHVLVNDPTSGYGIAIENMLEAAG